MTQNIDYLAPMRLAADLIKAMIERGRMADVSQVPHAIVEIGTTIASLPEGVRDMTTVLVQMMVSKDQITDVKALPQLLLQFSTSLSGMQGIPAVSQAAMSVSHSSGVEIKASAPASQTKTHETVMPGRAAEADTEISETAHPIQMGGGQAVVDDKKSDKRPPGWVLRKAAEYGDQPYVPIRESVTGDAIICLEDGRPMKMLKRHISTVYGMTAEDYRWRWGLPDDYPMVAPNYAKQKSKYARSIGLGTHRMRDDATVKRETADV